MASRGVFFAITEAELDALLDAEDDDTHEDFLAALEEAWDEPHRECDKAWDALHRLLGDGSLEPGAGEYPLDHCVLGPNVLDGEAIWASWVPPPTVPDVSRALDALDEAAFRERYRTIVPPGYAPEYGEEDLDYTWAMFQGIRELYRTAAREGRAVVFTVDG